MPSRLNIWAAAGRARDDASRAQSRICLISQIPSEVDVDEVLVHASNAAVVDAAAPEGIEMAHAMLHLDGVRHVGHAGDEDSELAVDCAPVEDLDGELDI